MEIAVFWLICAACTAIVASSKGRSPFGWLILGALFGIFALILVAALPRKGNPSDAITGTDIITPKTHVKCPDCAEFVKKEARVCKHCGCRLKPSP